MLFLLHWMITLIMVMKKQTLLIQFKQNRHNLQTDQLKLLWIKWQLKHLHSVKHLLSLKKSLIQSIAVFLLWKRWQLIWCLLTVWGWKSWNNLSSFETKGPNRIVKMIKSSPLLHYVWFIHQFILTQWESFLLLSSSSSVSILVSIC